MSDVIICNHILDLVCFNKLCFFFIVKHPENQTKWTNFVLFKCCTKILGSLVQYKRLSMHQDTKEHCLVVRTNNIWLFCTVKVEHVVRNFSQGVPQRT